MSVSLQDIHLGFYSEDIPFWKELARQSTGPILELGCGNGRVLLPLAQSGRPVYGIDNEWGVLALLRSRITPDQGKYTRILQADTAAFHFDLRFGLIIAPCNTYSSFSTETRRRTLSGVRFHLHEDGVFALSLPNPTTFKHLPARSEPEVEEIFPHPLDGEPVQVSSGWERSDLSITVQWHYDHMLPDGGIERISTQIKHNLISTREYLSEIRNAGFIINNTYGSYDWSPYRRDSPNLIILASKK
ncbi:methyltransferase domain-containing protein [Chloroflexota bacterium]